MKKKLAFVAASALAVSAVAVTAPAPADAAVTTAQPGFYDTTTNTYYTVADFQSLTQAQKKALVKDGVYLYTGENVISAKDAVLSTNEQLASKYIAPADFNAADLDAIYAASVTSPPVTGEFKVESVSAINTKTLKVTFDKAVEGTTKAVFAVKRGTSNVAVTAKWAEDKKSVELVSGANLLAGEHTVTVTGLTETALTGSVTVEAVKATTLDINTSVLNDETAKAKLNVQLKDQYGEKINLTESAFAVVAFNKTQNKDVKVAFDPTDGYIVDTTKNFAGSLDPEAFKKGDVVTVTVIHKATNLKVTKDVTVEGSAAIASITLGDIILPTGKTLLTADLKDIKAPISAKDQFGNEFKVTTGDLTITSTDDTIVAPSAVTVTDDGKQLNIAKFGKAGKVTINLLAKATGETATLVLDVQEAPGTITSVTLAETAGTVAAGSTKTVALDVKDNYGTAIKAADYKGKLTFSSTNTAVVANNTIDINSKGELEFTVAAGATKGNTTTITVLANNKAVATYTVTAGEKAVPTSVDVDSTSKHSTKLAVGATTDVKFTAFDQYGSKTGADDADFTVKYSVKNSAKNITLSATSNTNEQANTLTVTAAEVGTATVLVELINKEGQSVASKEVTFEVVANNAADVKVADIKDLAPTKATTLGAYKEEVKVETATGAALPASSIISVTSNNTDVAVVDTVGGKWYVQGVNATTTPAPADAKATLTVVYNADDKPVTLTKEVTVKTAAIAAADVVVYNAAFTTSDTGKVTVPTTAVATDTVSVKGVDFTSASSLFVGVVDNYGRIDEATTATGDVSTVKFTVSNAVNITSADLITVDVDATGKLVINKNGAALTKTTENGSFRILITTPNGRVKSVNVTVTAIPAI